MQQELKNCPFCGGEAALEECKQTPYEKAFLGATFSCGCDNEDCLGYQSITTFARRKDAITAWNIRADTRHSSPEAQENMRLREALERIAKPVERSPLDAEPSLAEIIYQDIATKALKKEPN